jgi:outer membrane autotransporter protein
VFGVSVAASETSFSAGDLGTSGRATGGHLGAYAVKRWGALYGAASIAYAHLDNRTTRTVTGLGPAETLHGRFAGDQLAGRLELGWTKAYARFAVTPFAAIEPSVLWQRGFTETGGILALDVARRTTGSLPLFLGAQVDATHTLAGGETLATYGRVSWVHEFLPNRDITAAPVSVPQASFTVAGARAARDALRLDAGATLALRSSWSLFANLSGEFSDRSSGYGLSGGVRTVW